ncbi:MAG: zf-HC2 domain-containing protein [Spirochaetota bacterium]
MKPCPCHDPSVLAGYYEGTLDQEQEREFSRHLLTCSRCLEALLNLERDLTLMRSGELRPVPAGRRGAVFQLGGRGLRLLQDLAGPGGFREVPAAYMRGEGGSGSRAFQVPQAPRASQGKGVTQYHLTREGVTLSLYPGECGEGRGVFALRLEGVAGKSVLLRGEGRVAERSGAGSRDLVEIENLEPGAYAVYLDDKELARFLVQEEAAWT